MCVCMSARILYIYPHRRAKVLSLFIVATSVYRIMHEEIRESRAPRGLEPLNFYWVFASLNTRIVTSGKFYILRNLQYLSLSLFVSSSFSLGSRPLEFFDRPTFISWSTELKESSCKFRQSSSRHRDIKYMHCNFYRMQMYTG